MSETQTALKIVPSYDPTLTTWHNIHNLLEDARKSGKEGLVAHHLIGASLQMSYPDFHICDARLHLPDSDPNRLFDFYIGDTAFHVTVSPMLDVCERCKRNLGDGLRVYLLVPDRSLAAARQNVDLIVPSGVAVESIESFVSQNIEEISYFSKSRLIPGFRRLLETYNARVEIAEIDRSLLIEIPKNL
jgi:hypothetical protein